MHTTNSLIICENEVKPSMQMWKEKEFFLNNWLILTLFQRWDVKIQSLSS
jgi:hypothetical protein